MRNSLFVFLCTLLSVGFFGCTNDEEKKSLIQPIDVTDSPIAVFFNTEWPEVHTGSVRIGEPNSFFYDPDTYAGVHIYENNVCVINSRQELSDIYQGEKALPEIDFDKYTLIIGQRVMGCAGYYITKKELLQGEDGLCLNLYIRNDARSDELIPSIAQILPFWGLYPKQPQKVLSVNVIEEIPNRN
jgi:hypothetical protein